MIDDEISHDSEGMNWIDHGGVDSINHDGKGTDWTNHVLMLTLVIDPICALTTVVSISMNHF